MADLQLPEGPSSIGPPSQLPPPITTTAIPTSAETLSPSLAPKRQRRPSVRLGEIGDQPATLSYETHLRRNKLWRLPKDSSKSSKTRPLTNLVTNGHFHEALDTDDRNLSGGDGNITIHDFMNRRANGLKAKRVRSNWVSSKTDDLGEGDEKCSSREDGCREFEGESSDSQLNDQNPAQSVDNVGQELWNTYRRPVRDKDGIQLDGMPELNWKEQKSANGIRNWLIGLGLGRYAPVFEIHEVDDEVLALLTLEDLKDMGINAVGSRRKMYTAIQKLEKGFS